MFFFFKQKTAYEMRISDWSSDVCSSYLIEALAKKSGITLNVRVEADTLSLMKSLSMLGYGSLLLPETAVLEEKSNPAWHATVLSDLTLTRYIARRVTPLPSNAVTCVYEILMEEIENLKSTRVMF